MKIEQGNEEKKGLTGMQWRILAWVVVFITGFLMMIHELGTFYP